MARTNADQDVVQQKYADMAKVGVQDAQNIQKHIQNQTPQVKIAPIPPDYSSSDK
jgi:hypothetical protein